MLTLPLYEREESGSNRNYYGSDKLPFLNLKSAREPDEPVATLWCNSRENIPGKVDVSEDESGIVSDARDGVTR